jgi:ribosomal protein S18 acetylase RimI-like enzyme
MLDHQDVCIGVSAPTIGGPAEARLRPGRRSDARRIAMLFRISSDGVADYIWQKHQAEHPGLTPLDIGQRRYERENVTFSYQNCIVAEQDDQVVGMVHAFVMPERDPTASPERDPVLAPVADLEVPGSLYLSGLAVLPAWRNEGLGSCMLDAARAKARKLGADRLSLICFEQNEGAMRLYRRQGFVEVDRRTIVPHPLIHYTGDAVLMVTDVAG